MISQSKSPKDKPEPLGSKILKIQKLNLRLFAFGLGTFLILAIFLFGQQKPLMLISADTRNVKYTSTNAEESTIRFLSKVAVKASPRDRVQCLSGLLKPSVGAKIDYSLINDTLVIKSSGRKEGNQLKFLHGKNLNDVIEVGPGGSIFYGPEDRCDTDIKKAVRLPIWGLASVGIVPKPPTASRSQDSIGGVLLFGEVRVFGRNITNSGIYPAGEFILPAGSHLSSEGGNNTEGAPWWGYATYVPPDKSSAKISSLTVDASTIANALKVKRLGGGAHAEHIEVGFFTQVTGDPFISGIGALFIILFVLSESIIAFSALLKRKD